MPSPQYGVAYRDWPVIRGDDNTMLVYFYDSEFYGDGDPRNVPSDLSGYTYVSSVSTGRDADHTLMTSPTVSVGGPGELIITMNDTETAKLVKSTYVWDLVEDPDTAAETTLVTGRVTVGGRATP